MEAGEYGLTRGTCFVARRLEVVAVAGLLWVSWCIWGAAGFRFFFFPNAHGPLHVIGRLASFTSLLVPGSVQGSIIISLSVCLPVYCVCATFVFLTDCERWTRPISTNPGSIEAGKYGLTRGTCFVAPRFEVVAVAGQLWV